jgi:hypothetical protein
LKRLLEDASCEKRPSMTSVGTLRDREREIG